MSSRSSAGFAEKFIRSFGLPLVARRGRNQRLFRGAEPTRGLGRRLDSALAPIQGRSPNCREKLKESSHGGHGGHGAAKPQPNPYLEFDCRRRIAKGKERHAKVAVECCGLRADIGNNSPRQILCSSLCDVGSPSDTDFRAIEPLRKLLQKKIGPVSQPYGSRCLHVSRHTCSHPRLLAVA
jgi:hypothetical protein